MNRENYKLYTWYQLTDNEYWVDFGILQEEFPNCQTIVCDTIYDSWYNCIMTYNECPIGWSSMAKQGTWKFMIIEKPKND